MAENPTNQQAHIFGEAFIEILRATIRQELEAAKTRNGNGHNGASDKLLDVDGLAAALDASKAWIYERTRRKDNPIPFYRVGRAVRFDLTEVKAWLRTNSEDN
jgi:excisionase family DNA binding protein